MEIKPKFVITFGFSCKCGNNHPADFYTMPAEVLKDDLSFGFSENIFRIVCKLCKAEYRVDTHVRRLENAEAQRENNPESESGNPEII